MLDILFKMRITEILVIFVCFKSIGSYEVFVDKKGRCETACLYNPSLQSPCCSIEYVASEYGSNVSNLTIHLPRKNINISQLVFFHNISYLSIIGYSKKSTLRCIKFTSTNNSKRSLDSGLRFVNVKFLKISNVRISDCGAKHFSVNGTAIKAAFAIVNCSGVLLVNIELRNSIGTALFIENTSGNVSLINMSVIDLTIKNKKIKVKPATSFAQGVFIYSNTSANSAHYMIKNSQFVNLTTPTYKSYDVRSVVDTTDWLGYGLGGGLSLVFDGDSMQTAVSVINCTFKNNFAPWGAGMYIRFQKNASFNSVFIVNSIFENCTALTAGGGLVVCLAKRICKGNTVYVHNSTFKGNTAKFGAGTFICALHNNFARRETDVFIKFHNCSWIENTAKYSPAVDISPTRFDHHSNGALPLPVFENCHFTRNMITSYKRTAETKSSFVLSGVFVITKFTVKFSGIISFDSNFYTALLINSGQIVFQENAHINFINNTGIRGGAISLNGFSSILINDNSTVNFLNNSATEYGGAIFYYPIEQREFFEGRVCFLKYSGIPNTPVENRNIIFVFSGNSASISGSSIYSTSFFSCYYSYRGHIGTHNVSEFFEEIGDFSFENASNIAPFLGTAEHQITNMDRRNQFLFTLPGMPLPLPIVVYDELKQDVRSEFFTRVKKLSNATAFINNPYTVNKTVVLYGTPNENTSLIISSQHTYRSIQYEIDIVLLPCSPGYYHDTVKLSCQCSYRNKFKLYIGIKKCNDNNFTAVIQKGYWAGYHDHSDELYTAHCPFEFCVLNNLADAEHSLPNSSKALSTFMCGSTRRGVLCGKCEKGFSTYYHSRKFSCGRSENCSYGMILFILSELLPVLIFFTIVVIFDISFSSGARSGFIFFCQMVTILPSEFITITSGQPHEYLTVGYKFIYGIFNIDFFSIESLSFCLFKNATVMDALAFKYITSLFALVLVLLLTIGFNYCSCFDKLCGALKKKIATKETVLHGLSAFLVICYAECVRVSFFILRVKILKGAGEVSGPYVAFYGGVNYFEGSHLLYVIPAVITLGTIAFFPPMLLLFYPSTLKLLKLCKLSEHRLVSRTLRITRINALMPMFDVFQGCFRDNYRFFAGLYFLYRVGLLVPYSFSQNLFECAVVTELVLVIILGLHSAAHPYKEKRYNVTDSLLFLNLAIINGISILLKLKMSESPDSFENNFMLKSVLYIQLLFIYLPVFILGLQYVRKLLRYCQQKIKKPQNDDLSDELDILDYLEYRDERTAENDDAAETELGYDKGAQDSHSL